MVQNVDYILGNNPTLLLYFVAADVNADDQAINVLDIVGTVDIILKSPDHDNDNTTSDIVILTSSSYPSNPIGDALFSWEGDDLYVESDHPIGGIAIGL